MKPTAGAAPLQAGLSAGWIAALIICAPVERAMADNTGAGPGVSAAAPISGANDSRCSGVTPSQAELYQQCAAAQRGQSPALNMRGRGHGFPEPSASAQGSPAPPQPAQPQQ